jgi:hypothetical protein
VFFSRAETQPAEREAGHLARVARALCCQGGVKAS